VVKIYKNIYVNNIYIIDNNINIKF